MAGPRLKRFRFGLFEADLESGELFHSGKKVPLQAKPFALLAALLQRHGEIVTRASLAKHLWPNTFVQADQGLNAAVRKVRRALRDDADNPKFIETLGSRGYRFIHPVSVDGAMASRSTGDPHDSATNRDPAGTNTTTEPSETIATEVADSPDDYLKGRFFLNLRTSTSLKRALAYFTAATKRDPNFTLAHCGLAETHVSEGMSELVNPKSAWEQAKASAARAYELDPTVADVYVPLAVVQLCLEHDWRQSTESLDDALKLNPNSPYVYFWYSFLLTARGDNADAVKMAEKAVRFDPVSLPMNTALSFASFFAGEYEKAIKAAERILELNDRFGFAYEALGLVYEAQGKLESAIQQYEMAANFSGRWPSILGYLGYLYAIAGNLPAANTVLEELKALENYTPSYELAVIHLGLGDVETSLREFERAYRDRSHRILLMRCDRRLQQLHARKEFSQLTSRVF